MGGREKGEGGRVGSREEGWEGGRRGREGEGGGREKGEGGWEGREKR